MGYILAIDQGTTSTRAILFDDAQREVARAQQEIKQYFPHAAWVEHDPEDIWQSVVTTMREVIARVDPRDIRAIGITNQRETTLLWDKVTGKPLHFAIVWQDRRTAALCERLKAEGHEEMVRAKTGLLLDPYFSATKLAWLCEALPDLDLNTTAFGTVDSWLIWRLTGGAQHATDATNAARTALYNIHEGQWDKELCALFGVPLEILPEVRECSDDFGVTDRDLFGVEIPITGVAGDQQAAAIGQACFEPGMLKATFGTGCFALLNTGAQCVQSQNRLLSTIAYRLEGQTTYALEGSIFIAGAVVQWLRDGLGVIESAQETYALALQADPSQNVIMVPAFTGLGAPWWEAGSRGAVFGLTRNSGPAELALAALRSVGYQARDLWTAMAMDWKGAPEAILRVDGGMSANPLAMQFLSDILNATVERPNMQETTALGAAWLAARHVGLWPSASEFAETWTAEARFVPQMSEDTRAERYSQWQKAVAATIMMGETPQ